MLFVSWNLALNLYCTETKPAIILALFLPMDQKLFSALYIDRPLNPPGTEVLPNILYKKREGIKQDNETRKQKDKRERSRSPHDGNFAAGHPSTSFQPSLRASSPFGDIVKSRRARGDGGPARARVLARLASLSQIGELARRLFPTPSGRV